MQLKILAFAHLPAQLGFRERTVECAATDTPRAVLQRLAPATDLATVRVAIDEEYRGWDEPIGPAKELALIPPVSGG
jgi:molybdopterin converting factor small subunit